MPFTITDDDRSVLYHDDTVYPAEMFLKPELVEQHHRLEFSFGRAEMKESHFDGFMMGFGTAAVHQRLHIESSEELQRIGMHFMIRGEVTSHIRGAVKKLVTSSYQHTIVYSPESNEIVRVERQPDIQMFGLGFIKETFVALAANNGPVLDRYAENVANNRPVYLPRCYHITPRMMQVIEEVRHCHFTGGLKKLFLQSKAIELLALQCEQIETESKRTPETGKVSRTDEEKIYHARDLLLAHAQDPLSLAELARKAGLNEFKLKNGFRKVFDNTVFGYLNDHRLEQSREMIRQGDLSFTEIADTLGYSSLQHFSNAFRKKYGLSPREVKKWA
ncbi:helix-turn-helix transcriptional regulator [Chitinophaga sp. GCM10012297]|uniref:Helix-turn-helix transcriptional regulator n=1 Tax=Chitinophaga chungangae TaxID=2821488 RepID=A0ABS3YA25_9BACT|nr:AraC family transcriptional regulator [Chitinophaga chungangae]MBO9151481.1 helix-turn-helix transcriptional regulator [Chitinophaga chungangae]